MTLLLLGGIGESRQLAHRLSGAGIAVIYSIAGLVRRPEIGCEIHRGGFSAAGQDGVSGLVRFIRARGIRLVVDATHPYAQQMSCHAVAACRRAPVRLWRFQRPGWSAAVKQPYRAYARLDHLIPLLERHRRPFFTIGQQILEYADLRPAAQHWLVRTAVPITAPGGMTSLCATGPFDPAAEMRLLRRHRIDALIAKDSGGDSVLGKLTAAHELGIAVYIQERPALPAVEQSFACIDALFDAVLRCVAV